MTTATLPAIDKRTAARSILILMEQAGLNTHDLEELVMTSPPPTLHTLPAWKQELLSLVGSIDPDRYPFFENPTMSVRQLRDLDGSAKENL